VGASGKMYQRLAVRGNVGWKPGVGLIAIQKKLEFKKVIPCDDVSDLLQEANRGRTNSPAGTEILLSAG